ncbi:MAG: hypothetical protein KF823_08530 [Xanthomonadales bacterium]|nr:hypothetical protein [Xanthomonadales bacterium]
MSSDDFSSAGLDRLSADELARLNDWLRANWPASAAAAYPAQADNRGLSDPAVSRNAIVSRIKGEFTGWNSRTTFTLENGMVWEMAGSFTPLAIRAVQDPTVIIEPGLFGAWNLRIEGYNASARVRRVR